jgi:hypothetical protein
MIEQNFFQYLPLPELAAKLSERTPPYVQQILLAALERGLFLELTDKRNSDSEHWYRRLAVTFTYYLTDINCKALSHHILNPERGEVYSEEAIRNMILSTLRQLRRRLLDVPEIAAGTIEPKSFPKVFHPLYYKNLKEQIELWIEQGLEEEEVLAELGWTASIYRHVGIEAAAHKIAWPKLFKSARQRRREVLLPTYLLLGEYTKEPQRRAEIIEEVAEIDMSLLRRLEKCFPARNYSMFSELLAHEGLSVSTFLTDYKLLLEMLRAEGVPCIHVQNLLYKEEGQTTEQNYYAVPNVYAFEALQVIEANQQVVSKAQLAEA